LSVEKAKRRKLEAILEICVNFNELENVGLCNSFTEFRELTPKKFLKKIRIFFSKKL
jgi:hypothetical protein